MWTCPTCSRQFRQKNQRHACGTGSRESILKDRPDHVVRTYDAIEQAVMSWPGTEVVTRDRYALFRTTKIFADLTVMREAIRLVMHLRRRVDDARFIKTVEGRGQISHVVKLRSPEELDDFVPLLREAYELVEGD